MKMIIALPIEQFFVLLEDLSRQRHDVFLDAAKLIISYLTRSPVTADEMLRAQLKGFASRASATIKREVKNANETPGFGFVLDALNSFRKSV